MLVVVGLYLLLRGRRQALLTYAAVVIVALGGYGGWYAAAHGSFGFDDWTGIYLYGRVAPFATCDYALTPAEAQLCPAQAVSQRTKNGEFYRRPGLPALGGTASGVATNETARGAVRHSRDRASAPDYLGVVLADTWHYFTPGRWMTTDASTCSVRFPPPQIDRTVTAITSTSRTRDSTAGGSRPRPTQR